MMYALSTRGYALISRMNSTCANTKMFLKVLIIYIFPEAFHKVLHLCCICQIMPGTKARSTTRNWFRWPPTVSEFFLSSVRRFERSAFEPFRSSASFRSILSTGALHKAAQDSITKSEILILELAPKAKDYGVPMLFILKHRIKIYGLFSFCFVSTTKLIFLERS